MEKKFDVSKGHRDWYGRKAVMRNKIRDTLRGIFEAYGYNPIETPLIEDVAALGFKGGGEIQKEVYRLKDQGNRDIALRFDQTVPLARFLATHQEIKIPFKRYVIGPVFRDGPTQPDQGRYRSFTQCDVDVLGIKEMTAEAELFALAQDAFKALGLGGVDVKINNRKLLDGVLDYAGVPTHAKLPSITTLDKMDKIGREEVRKTLETLTLTDCGEQRLSNETYMELMAISKEGVKEIPEKLKGKIVQEVGERGYKEIVDLSQETDYNEFSKKIDTYSVGKGQALLKKENVEKLMDILELSEDNEKVYSILKEKIKSPLGKEGLGEIRQLLDYSKTMGFDFIQFDPSLARGLDYYTGTTIEVYLKNKDIVKSAILAGGRFDDMVGDFRGGEEIPAVGFSFGLERLAMILDEKEKIRPTCTQLYIAPLGTTEKCLHIANELRGKGINVDMDLQGKKLKKSMSYANSMEIPYVAIIGEDEIASGEISVKDMETGKQEKLKLQDIPDYILREK